MSMVFSYGQNLSFSKTNDSPDAGFTDDREVEQKLLVLHVGLTTDKPDV